jgi:type I restriction enzyme S subunit
MVVEKEFKNTEIGVIPFEWAVKPLKDVCTYRRGSFPQPYGLSIWYDEINGAPFVQVFDIDTNWKIKPFTKRYISELAQSKSVFARKGTIVLTIQGSIGRIAITQYDAFIDRTLLIFETFKVIFDKVYFCLAIEALFEKERENAPGGIIKTITKEALSSFLIPIPSLPEQTAIATALSDMDALIAQTEKLIEKKKAIKQGVMQELLTPKEGWEKKKLGDYVYFQTGFPFKSEHFNQKEQGVRLIKNRDLKSDDAIYYFDSNYLSEYIVQNNDVLIGMDGDFMPCLWRKGKALLNQRVGRLISKKEIDLLFLYYYLQKPLKEKENSTSATTVKHLSHSDIENIQLALPELELQKQISSILFDIDNDILTFETKLQKLKHQKQGMMQALLTGKIRLV